MCGAWPRRTSWTRDAGESRDEHGAHVSDVRIANVLPRAFAHASNRCESTRMRFCSRDDFRLRDLHHAKLWKNPNAFCARVTRLRELFFVASSSLRVRSRRRRSAGFHASKVDRRERFSVPLRRLQCADFSAARTSPSMQVAVSCASLAAHILRRGRCIETSSKPSPLPFVRLRLRL